jgi:hypothetical protein
LVNTSQFFAGTCCLAPQRNRRTIQSSTLAKVAADPKSQRPLETWVIWKNTENMHKKMFFQMVFPISSAECFAQDEALQRQINSIYQW